MTNDKEKLNIQLRIANMTFPMTILREQEEFYREAAKRIDDQLNQYRVHFPNQNMERYMTMIALHFSFMNVKAERRNDTLPYKEKLEEMTLTLEEYLRSLSGEQ